MQAPPILLKPPKPPRLRRSVPGRPDRSIVDAAQLDPVPPELKALLQWVCWKYDLRMNKDGSKKPTKVPYQADHQKADHADPATWTTYEAALAAYLDGPDFDGIGFVFSADDPYCGVDLDKCLNLDGSIKPWAAELYALLPGGYAEISPSGTGLKVWVRGKHPGKRRKQTGFGDDGSGAVEIYDRERYFTVTGRVFAPATAGGKP